jgi:hypothetical protein
MSRAQAVAVWRLLALSHEPSMFYDFSYLLPPVRTERRFAPMTQDSEKATRNWREIIADSYNENDPEKIRKLAEELDRALDQRDKNPVKSERRSSPRERAA